MGCKRVGRGGREGGREKRWRYGTIRKRWKIVPGSAKVHSQPRRRRRIAQGEGWGGTEEQGRRREGETGERGQPPPCAFPPSLSRFLSLPPTLPRPPPLPGSLRGTTRPRPLPLSSPPSSTPSPLPLLLPPPPFLLRPPALRSAASRLLAFFPNPCQTPVRPKSVSIAPAGCLAPAPGSVERGREKPGRAESSLG